MDNNISSYFMTKIIYIFLEKFQFLQLMQSMRLALHTLSIRDFVWRSEFSAVFVSMYPDKYSLHHDSFSKALESLRFSIMQKQNFFD